MLGDVVVRAGNESGDGERLDSVHLDDEGFGDLCEYVRDAPRPLTLIVAQPTQLSLTSPCPRSTGVSWDKQSARWRSTIKIEGVQEALGMYDDKVEAARAYDRRVRLDPRLSGRRLNFPEDFPRNSPPPLYFF